MNKDSSALETFSLVISYTEKFTKALIEEGALDDLVKEIKEELSEEVYNSFYEWYVGFKELILNKP